MCVWSVVPLNVIGGEISCGWSKYVSMLEWFFEWNMCVMVSMVCMDKVCITSPSSSTLKWEMYYRWFNRIFSIYKLILDILLLRSARYPHPIAWNYLCLFGGIFRPDKCFSLYFVSDFIGCSCLRFPYSSCRYPEACQGGNCVEKHRDATRDRTQDLLLTKRTRYLCAICPPLRA